MNRNPNEIIVIETPHILDIYLLYKTTTQNPCLEYPHIILKKRVPTQNNHTEFIKVKNTFVCDYQSFVIPSNVILTVNLFLENKTHLPNFGKV